MVRRISYDTTVKTLCPFMLMCLKYKSFVYVFELFLIAQKIYTRADHNIYVYISIGDVVSNDMYNRVARKMFKKKKKNRRIENYTVKHVFDRPSHRCSGYGVLFFKYYYCYYVRETPVGG